MNDVVNLCLLFENVHGHVEMEDFTCNLNGWISP